MIVDCVFIPPVLVMAFHLLCCCSVMHYCSSSKTELCWGDSDDGAGRSWMAFGEAEVLLRTLEEWNCVKGGYFKCV